MVTDYRKAVQSYDLSKQYTVLVPKVDKHRNEISGILMPEMAVPVATYAGWNVRGAFHAMGEGCSSTGSSIQLPLTAAAAQAQETLAQRCPTCTWGVPTTSINSVRLQTLWSRVGS